MRDREHEQKYINSDGFVRLDREKFSVVTMTMHNRLRQAAF
jgi:hypothetical protein